MPSRCAVLLTPPESSYPPQLPSRQQSPSVNPLDATLADSLASDANKRLTKNVSPVDATLTGKRGVGCSAPLTLPLCTAFTPTGSGCLCVRSLLFRMNFQPQQRNNPTPLPTPLTRPYLPVHQTHCPLSFQPLTNCPFSIPFVLIFIHLMGGGRGSPMKFLKYYFNSLKYRPLFPRPLTRAYPPEAFHYPSARKFDGGTQVLLQSSRVRPAGPAPYYLRRDA